MSIPVVKASGRVEAYDPYKLVLSLLRSGVPDDVARDIAEKVSQQVTPSVHTKHIFRMAKKLLKNYSGASCMRYSIKKAIYLLGPTGYPFEKYVGRILSAYGYKTEVNRIINGYCVTHEVDVLATSDHRRCVIECKYHSNGEKPADVKIALYVHSRFNDIKRAFEELEHKNSLVHEGWLVTNTRCSADAIKYAECVGLKIISWKYPDQDSLEEMIEKKRLYPVTILPSATKKVLELLLTRDIILVDEISAMDEQTFLERSGLDKPTALLIKKQADELVRTLPENCK